MNLVGLPDSPCFYHRRRSLGPPIMANIVINWTPKSGAYKSIRSITAFSKSYFRFHSRHITKEIKIYNQASLNSTSLIIARREIWVYDLPRTKRLQDNHHGGN